MLTRNEFLLQARSENVTESQEIVVGMMIDESYGWTKSMTMMMELRKKVMILRDIINFPPYDEASPLNEVYFYLFIEKFQKDDSFEPPFSVLENFSCFTSSGS